MKRVFTLLTFMLLTMFVVAQQRMNFLGQPLGCSWTTFKQRMVSKGYKYLGEVETNIHYFDGVFGGDDVTIGAIVTSKSKTVYNIAVVFDEYHSYNSKKTLDLKKNSLIKSFIKKYGNNFFEYGIYTRWIFNYGVITIQYDISDKTPIIIWYCDKLGEEKSEKEQESDY